MTRRRQSVKALLLALTALLVGCLPLLSLSQFLYLCGGILFVVSWVCMGMLLDLYVGFKRFDNRLDQIWRQRQRPRLVKR